MRIGILAHANAAFKAVRAELARAAEASAAGTSPTYFRGERRALILTQTSPSLPQPL